MELMIVAGALLMMLAVELFNRRSIWGNSTPAKAAVMALIE
jgi:branched-chain amino acid transport system permease protein